MSSGRDPRAGGGERGRRVSRAAAADRERTRPRRPRDERVELAAEDAAGTEEPRGETPVAAGAGRAPRRPADRARRSPRARPAAAPRARGPRSDLLSRVLVAVPAAVVAIIFVSLGGLPFALFMIAAGGACMFELYGMLGRWRPVPPVGFVALAAMVIAARYGSSQDVLEIGVASLPVAFLAVIARPDHRAATVSIAGTLLGVLWLAFAFAHAVLLRQLPHGGGVIIDILVGTFLADTAAYFGGRMFGRRPLAPTLSPHKTVEGLICGMLIAIVAVFVAGLYQDWLTQGDALLLGLAVAVLGPLGDLFESMIKRDAQAKDSGAVFGAHGGALDRLDAVIFTVVAGYYVWLGALH
ncbi:MAG TPA: phosphatidate cytidylyltransferase [Solirubrobacteraceae bacterium]|nr:phosphatidate cytidylyltransferase [Solirubrobacteraceae bacterium]